MARIPGRCRPLICSDCIMLEAGSESTHFIFLCSALIFILVLGLILIYASLAEQKNSLSVLIQSFFSFGISALYWVLCGHRLVFNTDAPSAFLLYQTFFAITASTVLLGAYIGRMRLNAHIILSLLWICLVYTPIAQWMWGESGWIKALGAIDYAGGLAVHISTGFSSLVLATLIGRRRTFFSLRQPVFPMGVFIGCFLLWLGWIGFNAGSSGHPSDMAINSALVTLCAGAFGAIGWAALDAIHTPGRIHLTGISYGLVCALVAITPAAGYLSPLQSLIFVAPTLLICFYSTRFVHSALKIDDSADVFVSHGISGLTGMVLTGLFFEVGIVDQRISSRVFFANVIGSIATIVYSMTMTFIIYKVIEKAIKIRIDKKSEETGFDISLHGQSVFSFLKDEN